MSPDISFAGRVGGENAGSATDPKQILGTLQLTFFPELMRNSQLFTELFEKSSRPALIRVRLTLSDLLHLVTQ